MLPTLARRLLTETRPRMLWKFAWNLGAKGVLAGLKFKRRLKRGEVFPAFVFISVTSACNLRCQGCWVSVRERPQHMPAETLERILTESKRRGNRFFGILGGEPLLHPTLWDVLARHPDCYFQVFTNGTLVTDEVARTMARLGNVTPLVSVEGLEEVSDERRGGRGVFGRTMEGIARLRREGLVLGVATSVCRTNIDDLVTRRFVERCVDLGVHYLWYYIYRPAGPEPRPELALSPDQVGRLRRFIVDMRLEVPLAVVDAYWDQDGRALCPAAAGISVHINPWGDVEPCPPVQFAADTVHGSGDLVRTVTESAFLEGFRAAIPKVTRGCVLMEDPKALERLVEAHGARDSSGRGTGRDELARMCCSSSHDMAGREIPERHWFFRFAKRHWYFGFGAYA